MTSRNEVSATTGGHGRATLLKSIAVPIVSFALGGVLTYFGLIDPLVPAQAFFGGDAWAITSVALACFVLGLGLAYIPYTWYREERNAALRAGYAALRKDVESLGAVERKTAAVMPVKQFEASQRQRTSDE